MARRAAARSEGRTRGAEAGAQRRLIKLEPSSATAYENNVPFSTWTDRTVVCSLATALRG